MLHKSLNWFVPGEVVTMARGLDVLQMKGEDVLKFLVAGTHLRGTNLDFHIHQYVDKRKNICGIYVIKMKKILHRLWRI